MGVGLADPGSGRCCLFKATAAATAGAAATRIKVCCECVCECVSVRYGTVHDGLERSKLESSQLIWMDCSAVLKSMGGKLINPSLGPSMRASACCID